MSRRPRERALHGAGVFAFAVATLVACEEPAPSPPAGTGGFGGGAGGAPVSGKALCKGI
jgi:hypothetical protein